MRLCGAQRRWWVLTVVLVLVGLVALSFFKPDSPDPPLDWTVDPQHRELVQKHAQRVLNSECRPGHTRAGLLSHFPTSSDHAHTHLSSDHAHTHLSSDHAQPYLWKDRPLPDHLFSFSPPFGFKGLEDKLTPLLQLLPGSGAQPRDKCSRCVVVGNGGILRGLGLGPLIDQHDMVIRLNSGPLGQYSPDVGNRTSVRVSYPEGTPLTWTDPDPHAVFVAVVYKAVDLNWVSAIVQGHAVSLWDRLFYWQKVPAQVPLEPENFRLLNPEVLKETAFDLLQYSPAPSPRLWGWDQNVPTLGVTAVSLASLLCDQVSVVGFGYDLSRQGAPLHYYDHTPMSAMLEQKMHNVNRETELLQALVREGTITDLSAGIQGI